MYIIHRENVLSNNCVKQFLRNQWIIFFFIYFLSPKSDLSTPPQVSCWCCNLTLINSLLLAQRSSILPYMFTSRHFLHILQVGISKDIFRTHPWDKVMLSRVKRKQQQGNIVFLIHQLYLNLSVVPGHDPEFVIQVLLYKWLELKLQGAPLRYQNFSATWFFSPVLNQQACLVRVCN